MSSSDPPLTGMIKRLQHVSVPSADLDRSERFYCGDLGLDRIPRPPFDIPGIWLGLVPGQAIHITQVGDFCVSDVSHFALQVDRLETVLERLTRVNIEFRLGDRAVGAGRQAYLSDPDGNVIEIIEVEQPLH